MPSSTSSSDGRPLPEKSLGTGALIALIVAILLMGGWEAYWRDYGSEPAYRNSDGLWAIQRPSLLRLACSRRSSSPMAC